VIDTVCVLRYNVLSVRPILKEALATLLDARGFVWSTLAPYVPTRDVEAPPGKSGPGYEVTTLNAVSPRPVACDCGFDVKIVLLGSNTWNMKA